MRDVLEEAFESVLFAENCKVGQSSRRANDRAHVALLCRPPTERVHNMRLRPRPVNDHPAVTPGNRNQLCAACFRLHDCCLREEPSTSLLSFSICAIKQTPVFQGFVHLGCHCHEVLEDSDDPGLRRALRGAPAAGLQLAHVESHPHRETLRHPSPAA